MDENEVLSWGTEEPEKLSQNWPKTESGEAELPALLMTVSNVNFRDELIVGKLEAYGIPCFKRYPGNGSFGKLVLGISGQGVELYVPESMLEDAQVLCREENEE